MGGGLQDACTHACSAQTLGLPQARRASVAGAVEATQGKGSSPHLYERRHEDVKAQPVAKVRLRVKEDLRHATGTYIRTAHNHIPYH